MGYYLHCGFSDHIHVTLLSRTMTRYNILRKGKIVFWNVSESELFERLEDYAVEQYVTGEKIQKEITYEPIKEED